MFNLIRKMKGWEKIKKDKLLIFVWLKDAHK